MCQMLLSINPQYVEQIVAGTKKFEYRKRRCSRNDVNKIIIYATSPIKAVIGEVDIQEILVNTPDEIWNQTNEHGGVSKEFFYSYYNGSEVAVAYKLGRVKKYEYPKSLQEYGVNYAPQSFVYLN